MQPCRSIAWSRCCWTPCAPTARSLMIRRFCSSAARRAAGRARAEGVLRGVSAHCRRFVAAATAQVYPFGYLVSARSSADTPLGMGDITKAIRERDVTFAASSQRAEPWMRHKFGRITITFNTGVPAERQRAIEFEAE